jgi:uncharacterized protein (TIGR02646 family)
MRGARKLDPPEEYLQWVALANEDWTPSYPINESSVRAAVIRVLNAAQSGLCVYCGRQLDMTRSGKTYHIEHFRPQHAYEDLEVTFENLFISCGQESSDGKVSQTCGTYKDDWFDERYHVEPDYPECMQPFTFSLNGKIIASTASATKMVEILNLNHNELTVERQQLLKLIDLNELDISDFWDDVSNAAESYAHMAYKHFNIEMP